MNLRILGIMITISFHSFSQIPNTSFELWTNGNPDSWTPNNFPPDLIPVTQSTDAHSGTFA